MKAASAEMCSVGRCHFPFFRVGNVVAFDRTKGDILWDRVERRLTSKKLRPQELKRRSTTLILKRFLTLSMLLKQTLPKGAANSSQTRNGSMGPSRRPGFPGIDWAARRYCRTTR